MKLSKEQVLIVINEVKLRRQDTESLNLLKQIEDSVFSSTDFDNQKFNHFLTSLEPKVINDGKSFLQKKLIKFLKNELRNFKNKQPF